MRRYLFLLFGIVFAAMARAQSYTCRYWIDKSTNVRQFTTSPHKHVELDVSNIAEGLHILHLQTIDYRGVASVTQSRFFVKSGAPNAGVLHYWFDGKWDNGGTLNPAGEVTALDVSALSEGIHSIHFQVNSQIPSAIKSAFFVKMPQGSVASKVRYWFDGQCERSSELDISGGLCSIDVSGLSEGIHTIHVQTAGATSSAVKSAFFVKMPQGNAASKVRYWFDRQYEQSSELDISDGLCTLDVSGLSEGIHTIHVQTLGATGSAVKSAFFVKSTVNGKSIIAYEYWLNEDFAGTHVRKEVTGAGAAYCLQTCLELPSVPLRVSDFHFENVNGEPHIFAKNDLHLRFYDSEAYSTERTCSYVDYTTRQKVEGVDTLISERNVTKNKPTENEIQWYHFPAAYKDSLRFQVNRACTVQVFSPSGKEVYRSTNSTAWGTFNVTERGLYHLALHSVTANYSSTTLAYKRIQKVTFDTDVNEDGHVSVGDVSTAVRKQLEASQSQPFCTKEQLKQIVDEILEKP